MWKQYRSYNSCVYHERYMHDMALFLIGLLRVVGLNYFKPADLQLVCLVMDLSHGLYNMVEHERESWYG